MPVASHPVSSSREVEPKPLKDAGRVGHECRWPVLEDKTVPGNFLFCCRPTQPRRVFCDEHMTLARGHREGRS